MRYGQVTVTTTPTLIISANCARTEVMLANNSDTVTVYIGMDDSVTVNTGLPFHTNETRGHTRGFGTYLGNFYGVTNSGAADIRYWETT